MAHGLGAHSPCTCSKLQLGSVYSCSQYDIDQEAENVKPEFDWAIAHKVDPQSHLLQQGSYSSQPLKAAPPAGDHLLNT